MKYKLLTFIVSFLIFQPLKTYAQRPHSTYYYQKKSLFEKLPNHKNEIIFLGNSISDGCEWSELFGNRKIKNRGISGDVTQGILDRLKEVTESKPKKIFLMIGINDLKAGKSVDYIIKNIQLIISQIQLASPKTKIYVQSLLPVSDHFRMFSGHTNKNEEVKMVNSGLQKLVGERVYFINLHEKFLNEEGKLNINYTNDGLHLNGDGYLVWKELIDDYVR